MSPPIHIRKTGLEDPFHKFRGKSDHIKSLILAVGLRYWTLTSLSLAAQLSPTSSCPTTCPSLQGLIAHYFHSDIYRFLAFLFLCSIDTSN